jgi:hypothetical protein
VFVPQSYKLGQETQVDWFEGMAIVGGEVRKLQFFAMRSTGSGDVPANITHAPLSRTVVGRPFAAGSKGHVTIQCGSMGMAGLVLSEGSVLLLCAAPQSM